MVRNHSSMTLYFANEKTPNIRRENDKQMSHLDRFVYIFLFVGQYKLLIYKNHTLDVQAHIFHLDCLETE